MRELRYAWRSLTRTPGFAVTAILILAVSVGAIAAVFSMLYGRHRYWIDTDGSDNAGVTQRAGADQPLRSSRDRWRVDRSAALWRPGRRSAVASSIPGRAPRGAAPRLI
jgi:hypothetical protein